MPSTVLCSTLLPVNTTNGVASTDAQLVVVSRILAMRPLTEAVAMRARDAQPPGRVKIRPTALAQMPCHNAGSH